jgi:hypothetical protein
MKVQFCGQNSKLFPNFEAKCKHSKNSRKQLKVAEKGKNHQKPLKNCET